MFFYFVNFWTITVLCLITSTVLPFVIVKKKGGKKDVTSSATVNNDNSEREINKESDTVPQKSPQTLARGRKQICLKNDKLRVN